MTGLRIRSITNLLFSNNNQFSGKFRLYTSLQECIQPNQGVIENDNTSQKILQVAVIGIPNAGKSTFINYLLDRKVCPTSSKVHTTRTKAKAIFTEGNSQIIFLDTPGLVNDRTRKRHNLEDSFISDCRACLKQADTIGVIHDASNSWTRDKLDIKIIKLLERFQEKPSFLVLNKVDTLKSKRKLLEITRLITMNSVNGKAISNQACEDLEIDNRGWPYFKDVFMVSALTGSGLSEVREYLINKAKPGEWLYPETVWSDQTPENIILNTVKATLLDFLPQEIPYTLQPLMELYEITDNGGLITVVIVKCPSERVATLIAGAANGKLRQITESVQRDLQNVFHQFVNIRIVLEPPKSSKKKH